MIALLSKTGRAHPFRGNTESEVAQVSNLLNRRASSMPVSRILSCVLLSLSADRKSAIRQVGSLRYETA